MMAPVRIAAATHLIQSYLPGAAHGYPHLIHSHPNDILIGSAIFTRFAVMSNGQTDHIDRSSPYLALSAALQADNDYHQLH